MSTKEKIVKFIREYHAEYQWAPSISEIGKAVGLSSLSTVHQHLLDLARMGRIVYRGKRQVRVVR
jgi:SOS-response transcriptional repressor LexA